jgi:hypothetical protein
MHIFSCQLLKLVEKDKDARLCCKGGIAGVSDIKKMSWFDGMDWKLLEEKKIIPPMRPDVSPLIHTVFLPYPQFFFGRVRETLTLLMSSKRSS